GIHDLRENRVKSSGCRASAAADANLLGGVWRRRPTSLNQRGWRMLEDACAKKRRLNPAWGQRRNFEKLNGRGRCADKWCRSSMIVTARCDHGHRAIVVGTIGVRMHALVQLRRVADDKSPGERCKQNARKKNTCATL